MTTISLFVAFFLHALCALAKTTKVEVGKDGLSYSPSTIMAAKGDMVVFEFYPRNHSVVEATYDNPCMPKSGGIFSGFFPTTQGEASKYFEIKINNTNPIWLYCAQDHHCQLGMVAVINPPSGSQKTLKKFMSAASSASANVAPTRGVTGGMIVSSIEHSSSNMEYASTSSSMSSTLMGGTSATSVTASMMTSTMTSATTPVATSSANVPVITGAASVLSTDKKQAVLLGLVAAGCSWLF